MDRRELLKVRWAYPSLFELGSSKSIINNKQKTLQQYHWLVDKFFESNKLYSHYTAILNTYNPKQRKAFKSRYLAVYLQLMKLYLDNPQQYAHESSTATAKALSYWKLICILKYRNLVKYTNRLNHCNLPLPSGNNPRWDMTKKQFHLSVEKYHQPLFNLTEKLLID